MAAIGDIPNTVLDSENRAIRIHAAYADAVSSTNSSTALLGNAGVFTGTAIDTLNYSCIAVGVYASHASATDGLSLQQSSDGTNWDSTDTYTIPATTGKVFVVNPTLRYFRVVYTNAATPQTIFRLQTVLRSSPMTRGSVQRPQDARTNDNDFDESIGYSMMFNGTSWDRVRGDTTNGIDVDVTRIAAGTTAIGDVGIQYRANATGAATGFHLQSAASTNATVVKASAGRLVGWSITNTNAAVRSVKFHNQATTPTAGTGVVQTITVPANSSREGGVPGGGRGFATGIAITTTTESTDAGTTAVGAGDLIIDLFYA